MFSSRKRKWRMQSIREEDNRDSSDRDLQRSPAISRKRLPTYTATDATYLIAYLTNDPSSGLAIPTTICGDTGNNRHKTPLHFPFFWHAEEEPLTSRLGDRNLQYLFSGRGFASHHCNIVINGIYASACAELRALRSNCVAMQP